MKARCHRHSRRAPLLFALASVLLALAAVIDTASADETMSAAQSRTRDAAAEVNGFGLRLFTRLYDPDRVANTVISPLSLTLALHLAATGAGGKTWMEFRQALDLGAKPMSAASADMSALMRELLTGEAARSFRVANGLWVSPAAPLRDGFAKGARAAFETEIASLDFTSPQSFRVINRWFAARTQGLIPDMLGPLPADTRLVLANALYFRGRWQNPFAAALTAPGVFVPGGLSDIVVMRQVPMMEARERAFLYRETENFQAVRLPFAGGRFEAVIVLPNHRAADWVKAQGAAAWQEVLDPARFDERSGDLLLPRLAIAAAQELQPALESVGLRIAFTHDADFRGLAEGPLWLDQLVHQTVLKLDEEGAEAAAATIASGARFGDEPAKPFRMVVDHPFLLALRHVASGTLVLVGWINDPLR
ncbi:MAG TPA: serpin family protein [Stellaceae bacterium]|nr:serpin family protein [Stellaceae bacterium]